MHAKHPEHWMDATQQRPRDKNKVHLQESNAPSAWDGSELKVVPATSITANIFVLDAVRPLIELMPVLEHRILKVFTPYHPDIWEHKLQEAGLTKEYPHVMAGLCFGFTINFPKLSLPKSVLIKIPSSSSWINFLELFIRKSRRDTILDQSHDKMSSPSLVIFNLPPFQSSQNLGDSINRPNKY